MTETYKHLRCPALLDIIEHGMERGCRNDTAYRLSQYYAAPRDMLWEIDGELITVLDGLTYDEVRALVEHWNTRNRPPLVRRELLTCIKQGMKLPCSYGKFGQGVFTKYPLKAYCDVHRDSCFIRLILHRCDAHE